VILGVCMGVLSSGDSCGAGSWVAVIGVGHPCGLLGVHDSVLQVLGLVGMADQVLGLQDSLCGWGSE